MRPLCQYQPGSIRAGSEGPDLMRIEGGLRRGVLGEDDPAGGIFFCHGSALLNNLTTEVGGFRYNHECFASGLSPICCHSDRVALTPALCGEDQNPPPSGLELSRSVISTSIGLGPLRHVIGRAVARLERPLDPFRGVVSHFSRSARSSRQASPRRSIQRSSSSLPSRTQHSPKFV